MCRPAVPWDVVALCKQDAEFTARNMSVRLLYEWLCYPSDVLCVHNDDRVINDRCVRCHAAKGATMRSGRLQLMVVAAFLACATCTLVINTGYILNCLCMLNRGNFAELDCRIAYSCCVVSSSICSNKGVFNDKVQPTTNARPPLHADHRHHMITRVASNSSKTYLRTIIS